MLHWIQLSEFQTGTKASTPIVNSSVLIGSDYKVTNFAITNNTPTLETSTNIKETIISTDAKIDETSILHDELYKANTRYSIAYNVFGELTYSQ